MGYWNNLFKEKFMTYVEESRDYGTSTGETEKFRQTRGLREIITVFFFFYLLKRTFGLIQYVLKSVENGNINIFKTIKILMF